MLRVFKAKSSLRIALDRSHKSTEIRLTYNVQHPSIVLDYNPVVLHTFDTLQLFKSM